MEKIGLAGDVPMLGASIHSLHHALKQLLEVPASQLSLSRASTSTVLRRATGGLDYYELVLEALQQGGQLTAAELQQLEQLRPHFGRLPEALVPVRQEIHKTRCELGVQVG